MIHQRKKKKIELQTYLNKHFFLHPSIYETYSQFIRDRSGKIYKNLDKDIDFDDDFYIICPFDKFFEVWDIIRNKKSQKRKINVQ